MKHKLKSIIKQLVFLMVTIVLGVWAIFYLIDLSEKQNIANMSNETILVCTSRETKEIYYRDCVNKRLIETIIE